MPCPNASVLRDFQLDKLTPDLQARIADHVGRCGLCSGTVQRGRGRTSGDRARAQAPGEPDPGDSLPVISEADELVDPLIGTRAGEYEIVEQLGQGGMGVVYLGRHPLIGKEVALKVLRPDAAENADHARRMLKEAQSVNAIRHRAIVDIFGYGQLPDGRHYLAMEYLQGEPLGQWFRRTFPAPIDLVLELMEALCSALQAAHAARFIHRDLKPGNVFVHEDDRGRLEVKLLDFGLAKQVSEKTTGRALGTPNYMAPEQIHLRVDVSAQTDLYSLGVLAYELVTGDLPFGTKPDIGSILRAQLEEAPRHPSQLRADLPPALEELLLSLLEKGPSRRPASAEVVRQQVRDIRASITSPSTARAGSTPSASPGAGGAPQRPFPWKPLLAGGVLLAAGTVGMLALLEDGGAPAGSSNASPGSAAVSATQPRASPATPEVMPEVKQEATPAAVPASPATTPAAEVKAAAAAPHAAPVPAAALEQRSAAPSGTAP
ncbi:MAG: protein kinase, partial [Deltaproteobacteria bacterium]|nr:protein kinase [Deltaproteobacteria bacterium]